MRPDAVLAVLTLALLASPALAYTTTTTSSGTPTHGTYHSTPTGSTSSHGHETWTTTARPTSAWAEPELRGSLEFVLREPMSPGAKPLGATVDVERDVMAFGQSFGGRSPAGEPLTGIQLYVREATGEWVARDLAPGAGGFGEWVALDLHGGRLLVASNSFDATKADRVWLYAAPGTDLQSIVAIPLPEGTALPLGGQGVALGDDWLAVTAQPSATHGARVLVYREAASGWTLAHTLADPAGDGAGFGEHLAHDDGLLAVTGGAGQVLLFDVSRGKLVDTIATGLTAIESLAAADGKLLVAGPHDNGLHTAITYAASAAWESVGRAAHREAARVALAPGVEATLSGERVELRNEAGNVGTVVLTGSPGLPVVQDLATDGDVLVAAELHTTSTTETFGFHVYRLEQTWPSDCCGCPAVFAEDCHGSTCWAEPVPVPAMPPPEDRSMTGSTRTGTTTSTPTPTSTPTTTTATATTMTVTGTMGLPEPVRDCGWCFVEEGPDSSLACAEPCFAEHALEETSRAAVGKSLDDGLVDLCFATPTCFQEVPAERPWPFLPGPSREDRGSEVPCDDRPLCEVSVELPVPPGEPDVAVAPDADAPPVSSCETMPSRVTSEPPVPVAFDGRATPLRPLRVELPDGVLLRYHVEEAATIAAEALVAADPSTLPVSVSAIPGAVRYLHVEPQDEVPLEGVTIEMDLDGLPEDVAASMGIHFWDGERWVDLAADEDGIVPATTPEGDLKVLEAGRDLRRGIAWVKVSHTSTYALAPSEAPAGPMKLEHKPADTTYAWVAGATIAVALAAGVVAAIVAARRRIP